MNRPRGHLTCPRCKRTASLLVQPYWESPWRELGGLCGLCCQAAAKKFDAENAWPMLPPDMAVPAVVPLDGGSPNRPSLATARGRL